MNYVPHTSRDKEEMLKAIGLKDTDELYGGLEDLFAKELDIGDSKSQLTVERYFEELASKNKVYRSIFLGAGCYNHYIPEIVTSITSREEFLTAYTPYQAELSQGILQSIFEYQTMICRLTGLDVSNASLYDGSTALADGILMLADRKKKKVLVSEGINPRTIRVLQTYLKPMGLEIEIIKLDSLKTPLASVKEQMKDDVFAVAIAQPNFYGSIEDADEIGEAVKAAGVGFIMSVEPISLGLLKTPFECSADIAVGEGQPLGLPMSYGGPYLGFIAVREKYTRKMVGRIVGKTVDSQNRESYVLTLQAREQHIRREKASSSICSNEALCALTASIYLSCIGKEGLTNLAEQCLSKAHYMAEEISKINGYSVINKNEFFNEFVVESNIPTDEILKKLSEKNILGGLKLSDNTSLWCATEMNTKADIDELISVLSDKEGL